MASFDMNLLAFSKLNWYLGQVSFAFVWLLLMIFLVAATTYVTQLSV